MNFEEKMCKAIEIFHKKEQTGVEEAFIRAIVDEALEDKDSFSLHENTYARFAPIILCYKKKYSQYYKIVIGENIVPLFAAKDDRRTYSAGTMCLLKYKNNIFGITAAHVVKRHNVKLPIKGFESVNSDSFTCSNDELDIAVLEMYDDLNLGFETCVKEQTVFECSAIGFLSKSYKISDQGKRQTRSTTIPTKILTTTESKICMKYERKNVYMGNDYMQPGAIIAGMSGGACITAGNKDNFFERKFSGIITDYEEKKNVITATRVEKIIEFIGKKSF